MTIAAGFRCNEGIVLCADTEETQGDIKQWRGKIVTNTYVRDGLKHVICFAGAGWTDYINTAIEKAVEGLAECNGIDEIRAHLEEKLLQFFDGHLANWAYFPVNERPCVELLIGVTTQPEFFDLFYYGGTAFYRTSEKAIGSGIILANNFITEYRTHRESLEELCHLAAIMLSRVKKQVIGCGGETHLIALRKGADYTFMEYDDMRTLEAEIDEKWGESNAKTKEVMESCGPIRLSRSSEALKKRIKADEPSI